MYREDYYVDMVVSEDPNSPCILPKCTRDNEAIRDVFCWCPLCEDPENLTAYMLAQVLHPDWVKDFFGGVKCPTAWKTSHAEFEAAQADCLNKDNCGCNVGAVTMD